MYSTTEDDDIFNPISTSNLASLFGTSMNKNEGDTSLTYTAPKQPRTYNQETSSGTPKQTTSQTSVIFSKFVIVFKLVEKNHASQGKCGLAIIGNHSLKAYEIIIYRSKQDIMTRAKLRTDFIFTVQENNFAHFCDDQKQQWSVHFENVKDIDDFTHELNIHGGKIIQANKNIDNVNTTTTNSEKDKSIIKESHPVPLPRFQLEKENESPSDSSSSQTKADILCRMAKMGQPILPVNLQKKSSGHSDSDTDEPETYKKPIKKRQRDHSLPDKPKMTQAINSPISSVPEYMVVNGQIIPVNSVQQHLPILYTSSPSVPEPFNIFLAESRTHNCELRMNINQLSSKLDCVLTKLDTTQQVSSCDNSTVLSELQLKLAEKVKELEENKNLLRDLQEKQETNLKSTFSNTVIINDLEQQNAMQATIILEQKQKIEELKKCNVELEGQAMNSQLYKNKLDEQEITINTLYKTLDDHRVQLDKFQQETGAKKHSEVTIAELHNTITTLQQELSNVNAKINLFTKKLKHSMNNLYQEIMVNFEDENIEFQSIQIKSILSQKLKDVTFTILQQFINDFKNSHECTESSS